MFESLLHLQAQGKHKQALETVEGRLGDVMSMAADRRSFSASLHVRLALLGLCIILHIAPFGKLLPCRVGSEQRL